MATTIIQSFSEYSSNLNVTDRQESLVSTCRTNVVKAIDNVLYLHSSEPSKLIGSWDRKTLIRPLSQGDVDVMVVLNYDKNKEWETPGGTVLVLDKFKAILDEAYPKTAHRRDVNCITMQFSEFKFDVVPAFRYTDGYYTIPDTVRRQWVKTDPIKFAQKITAVNQNMGGDFVPLIKMVKGWNRNVDSPIGGFHLENLMYHHYQSYTQGYSYSSTIKRFFGNLPSYLSQVCYDPVTGDKLDTYMDNMAQTTVRQIAINKANTAKNKSAKAYEYEQQGDGYEEYAINGWKELLGDYFPAYG